MSGSIYSAKLTGYRIADLIQGDTIERVAARELGDATMWRTLVAINDLVWPFITDDDYMVGPGVLPTTGTIKVPAAQPAAASAVVDDTVFGTDLLMTDGQLQVSNGDLATVSGAPNLVAAIWRRIKVAAGELPYYLDYGCLVQTLIGKGGNAANNQLAAAYVKRAVVADPRISSMQSATAMLVGDSITVDATAITVSGKVLPAGTDNVSN